MQLRYRIVNVFTQGEDRFSGNPLAVFEDARSLDDDTMQRLALQFNLSETTFILPSQHAEADARVRIFTPAYEMPFAGHPTLGTAYVVSSLRQGAGELTLDLVAGRIPVRRSGPGRRWQLRANAATTRSPGLSPAALAELVGLPVEELAGEALWVNTGNEQLVVPLRREQAVRQVQVRGDLLGRLACTHGNPKVYVFAELGQGRVLARFFFPKGPSLVEDPATGSACANLGGYYVATGAARPLSRVIAQGEYTGRPSTLYLDVAADGAISVAGEVIELGAGVIDLP